MTQRLPQRLRRRSLLALGSLAVTIAALHGWQRQLPGRLERAAGSGQLQQCLQLGDQLQTLTPWAPRPPEALLRCRRQRALQLWQQQQWQEALALQAALLTAPPAGSEQDRLQLRRWQESLREQALERFRGGDLNGALRRLEAITPAGSNVRSSLAEELQRLWTRNRLLQERAERLSREGRWWEALDSLNRIDHPWWQRQSQALRKRVQTGLSRLEGSDREHDSHGALPHTVAPERLDAMVQQRIQQGMAPWQAFATSCQELGGRVVEAGPDSACQR